MKSPAHYTDDELDDMQREIHQHCYLETLDSKEGGVRVFKCEDCGYIRKIKRLEYVEGCCTRFKD